MEFSNLSNDDWHKVSYLPSYEEINIIEDLMNNPGLALVDEYWAKIRYDIVCAKSADWEYEQEYRFIRGDRFFWEKPRKCDKDKDCWFELPYGSLTGIIFGPRTLPCVRQVITNWLVEKNQKTGQEFTLYTAEPQEGSYKLDIKEYARIR